ncbi:hypothetical protein EID71_06585 [Salmonella enterica subsp. indica serovar 11:b:e,n,x]|nr:hypothetical protein [Salmonella enterica subsp. indica serovar 11:b:e,n,x]
MKQLIYFQNNILKMIVFVLIYKNPLITSYCVFLFDVFLLSVKSVKITSFYFCDRALILFMAANKQIYHYW